MVTSVQREAAFILALGLMTVAIPVSGLPTTGQDDAGSGSDAGDVQQLATPVTPGTYQGELATKIDETDIYALDVGTAEVIEANVSAKQPIDVTLVDPNGTARDTNGFFSPTQANLSDVARPLGTWFLRVEMDQTTSLDTDIPYRFAIRLEQHDHVQRLASSDEAVPALRTQIPDNAFTRLQLDPDTPEDAGDFEGFAGTEFLRLATDKAAFQLVTLIRGSDAGNPTVRSEGILPEDVHVGLQPPTGLGGLDFGRIVIESSGFTFNVSHGAASSLGIDVDGWLVWDGEAPTTDRRAGEAAFLATDDMEATGPTLRAGPYIDSEALEADFQLPHAENIVYVDSRTPEAAREPADVVAHQPDGSTLDPAGGDVTLFGEVPTGDWNVTVRHIDGLEYDRIRLAATSYPFAPFESLFR